MCVRVVINFVHKMLHSKNDSSYDNVRAVIVNEKSTGEGLEVTTRIELVISFSRKLYSASPNDTVTGTGGRR